MKTGRLIAWGIAGAVITLASGMWLASRTSASSSSVDEFSPPARPAPLVSQPANPAPVAAPQTTSGPITPPEGMTSAQWDLLRDQLKDHPQREAEIARVGAAVTYLSRLNRFRAQRQPTSAEASPADRELAAWLLEQLPARIANREVSGSEGRRLSGALLDALAATPAQRELATQALADAVPADSSVLARAELDLRYQRESAALLATWQAQPPGARNAEQLEASLLALRGALFTTASADATAGVLR